MDGPHRKYNKDHRRWMRDVQRFWRHLGRLCDAREKSLRPYNLRYLRAECRAAQRKLHGRWYRRELTTMEKLK